jgi:hypothetical protein
MKIDAMHAARRWSLIFGIALLAVAAGSCGARTGLWTPDVTGGGGCCIGGVNTFPRPTVQIAAQIMRNPGEIPELAGCGTHGEEITEIRILGPIGGCVSGLSSSVVFPTLTVLFKMSSGRCGGRIAEHESAVHLTEVAYNASYRFTTPACIVSSSVSWSGFDSRDPGFMRLFSLRGPETLRPILDRFLLTTAEMAGTRQCPATMLAPRTVTRCP